MVEQNLRLNSPYEFVYKMFGNSSNEWSENLPNEDKLRYTINALMRMRFCDAYGKLEFKHKDPNQHPKNFKAWFLHTNRIMSKEKIFIFDTTPIDSSSKDKLYIKVEEKSLLFKQCNNLKNLLFKNSVYFSSISFLVISLSVI